MRISKRLANVKPSVTMAIDGRAKQLKAEGADVIGLAAGEPDFLPPDFVVEAAAEAMRAGRGRYTQVAGALELRDAVLGYMTRRFGLEYGREEVIVTSGAKQALFNALYVLCDEGDEVVIPVPFWTSYPEMAEALGCRPVLWPTRADAGFSLDLEALDRLITPRTRVIMLNSPSNPSGAVTTEEELAGLADLLARHPDIWILSDDIYAELTFGDATFQGIVQVAPSMRERSILVNGMSKTFCMTGWRVGWATGPRSVIGPMTTIQSHTTSCANAIAQVAAAAALNHEDDTHLREMVAQYRQRAEFVHERLGAMPGVASRRPQASFYAFPDVDRLFGKRLDDRVVESSMDLCNLLLDECLVALVPGEAFGYPAGARLSFAASMGELGCALDRMAGVLDKLR